MAAGKVLVVDDDPTIQRLLEVNLEMEGYDIVLASDGEEALEVARAERPDLILLDVMMPKKDGWQVCTELRADEDPVIRRVPIVFLSARAQDADADRGVTIGADEYVTKPFDPMDLLDLIASLLARQR